MFYVESALLSLMLEHYFFEDSRRKKRVAELVDDGSDYYKNLKKLNYDPKSGTISIDGKRVNLTITGKESNTFSSRASKGIRDWVINRKREDYKDDALPIRKARGGIYVSKQALSRKNGYLVAIHEWQHNRHQLPVFRNLDTHGVRTSSGYADTKEFTKDERRKILELKRFIKQAKQLQDSTITDAKRQGVKVSSYPPYIKASEQLEKMESNYNSFMNSSSVASRNVLFQKAVSLNNLMLQNAKRMHLSDNPNLSSHDRKPHELDADAGMVQYGTNAKYTPSDAAVDSYRNSLESRAGYLKDKSIKDKNRKDKYINKTVSNGVANAIAKGVNAFGSNVQYKKKIFDKNNNMKVQVKERSKNMQRIGKMGIQPIRWN